MPIRMDFNYDDLLGKMLEYSASTNAPLFRPDYPEDEILRQPTKLETFWDTAKDFIPFGNFIDKWRSGEYKYTQQSALPELLGGFGDIVNFPSKAASAATVAAGTPLAVGAMMGSPFKEFLWRQGSSMPKILVPKEAPSSRNELRNILLSAVSTAKEQNVLDDLGRQKVLATLARTARSLSGLDHPGVDLIHRSFGYRYPFLDIPIKPKTTLFGTHPLPIRATNPTAKEIGKELGYHIPTNIKGFFAPTPKIMVYNADTAYQTAPHEILHGITNEARENFAGRMLKDLDAGLRDIVLHNPKGAKELKRKSVVYRGLQQDALGEELLARYFAKQMEPPPGEWSRIVGNPQIRAIIDEAQRGIDPRMFRDALDDYFRGEL